MKNSLKSIISFLDQKWRVTPLFFISFTAIVGTIIGELNGSPSSHWAIALICTAIGFVFLDSRPLRIAMILCATAFGFAALHSQKIALIQNFPLISNLENGESVHVANISAKIIAEPTLIGTGAQHSGRAVLEISKFQLAGRIWHCDHQFPALFEFLPDHLKYGDEIQVSGIFQPLLGATSPGAFDEKKFHFRTHDAAGKILIQTGDRIRIVRSNQANPVVSAAISTRQWFEKALRHGIENYPIESRSVITAMVLGNREDAPEEIEDLFRLSGTMHIFAVSGLHVGIIATAGWFILPMFGVSRRTTSLILIPAILFYAFITGLRPSAIRAAIMISVVALAFCARKNQRILNSLGFAALIILLLNTQEVFQIGFQLSFAVLLAIVLFAKPITAWFYRPFEVEPLMLRRLISRPRLALDWLTKRLSDSLGISLAAWIGSLVLIGWYFKIISLTGILANIVMIPTAAVIIGTAIASSISFAIHATWITAFLNQINAMLASLLVKLAFFFSTIPGGYLSAPSLQTAGPDKIPAAFSIEILANNGSMANLLSAPALKSRRTDSQRHWLIDTGDSFLFRGKIQPLLRANGINQIDGIFLSHGDENHIGSTPIVIDRFNPQMLFESGLKNRARIYKKIQTLADLRKIQPIKLTRGGQLDLGGDIRCEILFPPEDYANQSRADDQCLVLRLRHHQWKILFTFDAGFTTEKWLLENRTDLQADIWIKGRHNASPSGLIEFLDHINPRTIIATNSRSPIFEQIPDKWILELEKRGIDFFDLSVEGSVSINGSKEKIQIDSFLDPNHRHVLKRQR